MTIQQFRTMTGDNTTADAELEQRLKAAESMIRNYTHNNFQVREKRSQSAVENNILLTPPRNISVGDTVQISGSLLNNGVYTVRAVNSNGIALDGRILDCQKNTVTLVKYPPDVISGAADLIKWSLENKDRMGVKQEKISRHTVTYFDMEGENSKLGFPSSMLGFLKPYMKARF